MVEAVQQHSVINKICLDVDYKNYLAIWKKVTKFSFQRDFLDRCIKNHRIPKGILGQSTFTLSFPDDLLQNKVQYHYRYAASRTLDDILSVIKSKTNNNRRNLAILKESLKHKKDPIELTRVMEQFKIPIFLLSKQLRIKHDKKFNDLQLNTYIPATEERTQNMPTEGNELKKSRRRTNKKERRKSRPKPSQRRRNMVKGDDAVKINDQMILNLSGKELTVADRELLTLGENFAPTPTKVDYTEYHQDIDNWINSLKWYYHFHIHPSSTNNPMYKMEKKIIPKSNTKPAQKVVPNHCLGLFIENVTADLKDPRNFRNAHDNLSIDLRKALNGLKEDPEIVLRFFDKGTGWVIDSTKSYISRMNEQLSDTNTFIEVTTEDNLISNILDKVRGWTETYNEFITPKLTKAMLPEDSRPGYDYGNYKAHKPEKQFPLRLITSVCGSPIQALSSYVEYHLRPLVLLLENVIIDTNHCLRKIKEFNETFSGNIQNIILATWDIEAMFPSIDNELGIQACKEALDKRLIKDPPTECVVNALRIVLENNISFFNNKIYKQIRGTAMGPNHACSYGDLAIDKLDQKIINNPDYNKFLGFWARLRDDCLSPWLGTSAELINFTTWMNTLNTTIKYKLESYSIVRSSYLDFEVFKHENKLETTIYQKPSDTHCYLSPRSCHPPHIARNIARGVAKRVRKLCSLDSDFDYHADKMVEHFSNRGYNAEMVKNEFIAAKSIDRFRLFSLRDETNGDDIIATSNNSLTNRSFPLVTTFNPNLPDISRIIYKHKHILGYDSEIKYLIDPSKVFACFRR